MLTEKKTNKPFERKEKKKRMDEKKNWKMRY